MDELTILIEFSTIYGFKAKSEKNQGFVLDLGALNVNIPVIFKNDQFLQRTRLLV